MPRAASSIFGLAALILLACPAVRAGCATGDEPFAPPAAGVGQSAPAAAQAAQAPPPAAADVRAEAREVLAAVGRLEDADTALSLAAEGAALYDAEKVKLDGYAYCSQAVELAEQGEFRESARAASKALHVALQSGNVDLLGKAYRDLAIAFSYAGQLQRAEQFANLALK